MKALIYILRSAIIAGALIAIGFVIGTASSTLTATTTADATADEATFFRSAYQPALTDTVSQQSVTIPQLQSQAQQVPIINEIDLTRADLYERVAPSVVSIIVIRPISSFAEEGGSSGSGFVIDTTGNIVTNYHVVEGATEIVVSFYDGTITRAEIIGLDADSDIAVIKVDLPEDRLFPVRFGDVEAMRVGESVVAIGSPFEQNWTLTSGIISNKSRSIDGLGGYRIGAAIQTDTAINPGNSGGPLLNMRGEVVGVTSQILSRTRSNSGIGFAVPADLVERVAEELIRNGRVAYSFIGISGRDVNLNIMETGNLANNQRGVVVCDIVADSPAALSQLRPDRSGCLPYRNGDIIVSVDSQTITGFEALISYLARATRPGDTVTFGVLRGNEIIEVQVMLGNRPAGN